MKKAAFTILLLLLAVSAIPLKKWDDHHQKKFYHGLSFKVGDGPQAQYVDSRVDNFDGSNLRTYRQKYYVNDTYWKGASSNAPVFLFIDGEGPGLTPRRVLQGNIVEQASRHGALILALEHRYYGESIPTEDFSTENLKYLSAHQALADAAGFIAKMNKAYNLTSKNKWITFGGSYPGMLSSWMRLNFPHLVHGSISNSGPVRPEYNFKGYLDVVKQAYEAPEVGGSVECRQVIEQGHYQIGKLLQTDEGRQFIAEQFNICPGEGLTPEQILEIKDNQATFAGFGVGPLGGLPQYNNMACQDPLCNIEKVCKFMLSSDSGANPVEKLSNLTRLTSNNCTDVNYETQLNNLASPNISTPNSWYRIWQYQTCTEFAFYQTCDEDSLCPFTKGLNDIDYQVKTCQVAFNISAEAVQERVEFSAQYWGSERPQGSRVLYTNGQVDPWHYLSVLNSQNSLNLETHWVIGASHCQWMGPTKVTDNKYLVLARQTIGDYIDKWLLQDTTMCQSQ